MKNSALLFTLAMVCCNVLIAADSLLPLESGKVPQTFEELWTGYDPAAEPLDVQIVHEWKTKYEGKDITGQMLTLTVANTSRLTPFYLTEP